MVEEEFFEELSETSPVFNATEVTFVILLSYEKYFNVLSPFDVPVSLTFHFYGDDS